MLNKILGYISDFGLNVVKDKLTNKRDGSKIKKDIAMFAKSRLGDISFNPNNYEAINFDAIIRSLNESLLEIKLCIFDTNIDANKMERYWENTLPKIYTVAAVSNDEQKKRIESFIKNDVFGIVKDYYNDKLDGKYKLLATITRDGMLKSLEPLKKDLLKRFSDLSDDVLSDIKNLNDKVDKILDKDEQKIKTSEPETVTIDSAHRPTQYFKGREDKIISIKKLIEENKNVVLVSGMGGIGKSEICKNLFYEYKNQKNNKNIKYIGWLNWNNNLKDTLFHNFHKTKNIQDPDENYNAIIRYINDLAGSLLLFIDNMNDDVSQKDKLVLDSLPCMIVVTSRLNEITNFKRVEIDELSEDDCVQIYKDVLEKKTCDDDNTIREVVKKTGRITLVIELLARTAKTVKLSDKELLKKLKEKGFDLSEIKNVINMNEKNELFNVHLSHLFDLSRISNEELLILKQFSLFPTHTLEYVYAKKWFEHEPNLNILNDLAKKAWLKEETDIGFYMHHVISDVVRYKNSPKYKDCAGLVNMIMEDFDSDTIKTSENMLKILPFAERVASFFYKKENENIAFLLHNVAKLYERQASYENALNYYKKDLNITKTVLNKKHLDTAKTCGEIAEICRKQGNLEDALKFHEETLSIRKEALDKEPIYTAVTYNKMGAIYRKQYNHSDAHNFYDNALKIFNEKKVEEHPEIAIIYNNKAAVHYDQGDYNNAVKHCQKALTILESHKDGYSCSVKPYDVKKIRICIATAYDDMGVFYHRLGNYDMALDFHKKALAIRTDVHFDKHPNIATTYNNMGLAYSAKNDFDTALNYYNKALAIRIDILGKRHPNVARTYNNMADVYRKQCNYIKAIEFCNKALAIRKIASLAEHRDTATFFDMKGMILYDQKNYDKALKFYNKALTIRENVLDKKHPDTATTYYNKASVCYVNGIYNEALELYTKSYRIRVDAFGLDHQFSNKCKQRIKKVYDSLKIEVDFENWLNEQLMKTN